MKKNNHKSGKPDFILMGLAGILVIFGLVMLASASPAISFEKWQDSFYMLKHQILFGLIPGLIFFVVGWRVSYLFWKKIAVLAMIAALGILVLLIIPGVGSMFGGSKSWFVVKGVSFQPVEFAKVCLIFYLAALFEKKGESVEDFKTGALPFLIVLGLTCFLIFLQPDIGTMMIVAAIGVLIYFFAGAAWKHLLIFAGAGAALIFTAVKLMPSRATRLLTFLHPELDPQGIGYHINQALIAVGSGGLWGLGFGQSRQKFRYLPEVSGDSIFAITAEELGFFVCVIFIILLTVFFYRIFTLAKKAPDEFSRLVVLGIGGWFVAQSFVNISAMVGLLPLTGLPLPFISYGGTALAMNLFAVGVLINISKYSNQ